MQIQISYKNIKPDVPLKIFVKEKIGSIEKLLKDDSGYAQVEIGKPSAHHRKGEVFYAEANIKISGKAIRTQSFHADLRSAIVEVKNKIQREFKKIKDKKVSSRRKTS